MLELPIKCNCLYCNKTIVRSKARTHSCAPKRAVEQRLALKLRGHKLAVYDPLILWDTAAKEMEKCGTQSV